MKSKTLGTIVISVLSIVLVFILLSQVSIKAVVDTFLSIDSFFLIAGFLLYSCTYILRAFRFSLLLNRSISMQNLLPMVSVHIMMNNILPVRTGELSYVYLLKKIHARTTGEGLATLVVARIFDFIVIIVLLFISRLFIRDVPAYLIDVFWIFYVFLICLLMLLLALVLSGSKFLYSFKRVLGYFHLEKTKFGDYILRKGYETVNSCETMEIRKTAASIVTISVSIWFFSTSALYTLLAGMGIFLPVQNVIFASSFILLTSILPIYLTSPEDG